MADTPDQAPTTQQSFLTPDERAQMQRFLSFPEEFPAKFGSWFLEYLRLNGQVDKWQVNGLAQLAVHAADGIVGSQNLAAVSGYSSSWVDLPTPGPTLTGLANGLYLVNAGCAALVNPGMTFFMGLEVNGVNQAVADGSFFGNVITAGNLSTDSAWFPGARTFSVTLDQNNNNTIVAKYRCYRAGGSFSLDVRDRWMSAIKYGEVQGG